MAKAKTKSSGAKKVKKSKNKSSKSTGNWFTRFLDNPKRVALAVFVIVFVVVGSFQYYRYSSAATAKTVGQCKQLGIVLRKGSTGACVKSLQGVLRSMGLGYCGYWTSNLALDGIFGQQTYGNVICLQSAYRITVDGVVGQQTWGVLTNYCWEQAHYYNRYPYGCLV